MRALIIAALLLASIALTWTLAAAVECGKEKQPACKLWERVPSCDPYLVVPGEVDLAMLKRLVAEARRAEQKQSGRLGDRGASLNSQRKIERTQFSQR